MSNPTTTIRRAVSDDASSVSSVFQEARQTAMPWLPVIHTVEETDAWIAQLLIDLVVWVAEVSDEVVGFAAFDGEWLHHLYVRSGAQSRGVGSALLQMVKNSETSVIRLYTFEANETARKFYERHGFTISGRSDGRHNEERYPDLTYIWTRPVA